VRRSHDGGSVFVFVAAAAMAVAPAMGRNSQKKEFATGKRTRARKPNVQHAAILRRFLRTQFLSGLSGHSSSPIFQDRAAVLMVAVGCGGVSSALPAAGVHLEGNDAIGLAFDGAPAAGEQLRGSDGADRLAC
jgi:hypothetical protein